MLRFSIPQRICTQVCSTLFQYIPKNMHTSSLWFAEVYPLEYAHKFTVICCSVSHRTCTCLLAVHCFSISHRICTQVCCASFQYIPENMHTSLLWFAAVYPIEYAHKFVAICCSVSHRICTHVCCAYFCISIEYAHKYVMLCLLVFILSLSHNGLAWCIYPWSSRLLSVAPFTNMV